MFHFSISCLTMANLPWFMDLTFQVPMQYCSLQNQTLLSPPDTSMADHHSCFGPGSLFLLELLVIALYSSPVACWTLSVLWSTSGVVSFCLFIVSVDSLRQEYWSELTLLPPMDHNLSELSTMAHPSWVAFTGLIASLSTQAPSPWQDCDSWRGKITQITITVSLFPMDKHSGEWKGY